VEQVLFFCILCIGVIDNASLSTSCDVAVRPGLYSLSFVSFVSFVHDRPEPCGRDLALRKDVEFDKQGDRRVVFTFEGRHLN
jgi:hypothetical protein